MPDTYSGSGKLLDKGGGQRGRKCTGRGSRDKQELDECVKQSFIICRSVYLEYFLMIAHSTLKIMLNKLNTIQLDDRD